MFYLIWYVVIIGLNTIFWPYFMLIKVRNYLAPNSTTADFRIRIRGPPANYVYGSHMPLVTRGSLGYLSHQKSVIQGHLVHRYASRRAPALCSMIMFRTVLSLDVSAQTVFLYNVRKNYLDGLFLMFCGVHVTHWLLCQTDEINTVFQSFIGYIYEGTGQVNSVNSSTIANICWLIQTFKYQFCGLQVHFESNMMYDLKTKSDLWSKCPDYIMDYMFF